MNDLINNSDFTDIMTFNMVPYGNANNATGTVQCQHGPDECTLNGIESCLIDAYPNAHDWYSTLVCIDGNGPSSQAMIQGVEKCMSDAGLDYSKVDNCVTSGKVNDLQQAAAQATGALDPPHFFVPWVTVSGMPVFEIPLSDDADTSFPSLICFAARVNGWQSADLPKVCNKPDLSYNADRILDAAVKPCLKDH